MMKYLKNSLALLLLALCTMPTLAQTGMQVRQNNAVAEQAATDKLQETWNRFADALRLGDTASLRALSTPYLQCYNCPGDTTFIPFARFRDHVPEIFGAATLARLKDNTKLRFIDNGHNAELYATSCVTKPLRLWQPHCKEVLLTYIDPSTDFEGAQQAFAFIETKEGFKFCGYSTIP
ncbi:hypothetical protein [Taibaiella helva]|uniref:hypothetical protein n=1 Tax=Taibaiella helva TaxID=2301235 RepID=UPI000E573B67|nr:hypothetical protein [Taibaiella helva]